jgi:hypothetical protein
VDITDLIIKVALFIVDKVGLRRHR